MTVAVLTNLPENNREYFLVFAWFLTAVSAYIQGVPEKNAQSL